MLLLLLIGILCSAVYLNPTLVPANMRGLLSFIQFTSTPTNAPIQMAVPKPTSLPVLVSATATTMPATPTFTVTPTSMGTATIETTVLPVNPLTGTPTMTATLTPTPIGGGSGQIAFASDRIGIPQIYLSDLTGNILQSITNVPDGACQPSWSPDGKRLVFVSPCKARLDVGEAPFPNTALYIVNADGSNLTLLPTAPGGDFDPAWSPDGKRIAFTSLRDGYMQIYAINLDDQSVTRLTNTNSDIDTRQPAWSPFNNQIAYAEKRFDAYQIWAMTDTGQSPQQIVRSGPSFSDYSPEWSLDGKLILFNERISTGYTRPWVMAIPYEKRNTDAAYKLNFNPWPVENVHYSPDGTLVIFEGLSGDSNNDLFYETVSGENRTRITADPGVDFDPAWQPIVSP
jgi:Tol biopolymer transport system component